jgi:hypothetical protein
LLGSAGFLLFDRCGSFGPNLLRPSASSFFAPFHLSFLRFFREVLSNLRRHHRTLGCVPTALDGSIVVLDRSDANFALTRRARGVLKTVLGTQRAKSFPFGVRYYSSPPWMKQSRHGVELVNRKYNRHPIVTVLADGHRPAFREKRRSQSGQ